MRVFGYILLVLNLLLSGGLIYLGLQDYQGRQSIDAAGLRHIILLDGVPVVDNGPDPFPARVQTGGDGYSDFTATEIPFVVIGPGGVPTKTVSPELLYVYFAQAGTDPGANGLGSTTPVASQQAEVKRVYGILKQYPDAEKLTRYGNILLRLSESFEERNDYRTWMASGNVAELSHAMDLKFNRVLPKVVVAGPINPELWNTLDQRIKELEQQRDAAKKAADDALAAGNTAEAEHQKAQEGLFSNRIERRRAIEPRDESDRKIRLATLLVHLDVDLSWQKRTALVVGLRQYAKAIDGQSGRFKDILERVQHETVVDQERFISQYSQLREMAIQRTQLVLEMAEVRKQLTAQAQKDQDLVNQRQLQLDDLTAQRDKIKAEVTQLLAKQTLTEQALFLIEREIAIKMEHIYGMEAELRKVEIERYEQKK
jgi:hypothetical protein